MTEQKEGWWSRLLHRIDRAVTEDLSDFDPDADWDTRVKLPEWQLARLKERAQKARDEHSKKAGN
ncbi:MAG TPA: hypothetical protein DD440_07245 [Porticoccaceae bacterium]|nr:hypothetical protein [Porticoccaceae bacterium]